MAVNSVLQTVAGGLQLASAFSGIPYASLAGTLLSGILDAVQQIDVHKVLAFHISWPIGTQLA